MAERRQEAYGLEALREALRSREARCNRDNDQHDTKALKGEPPKDRAREVTNNNGRDRDYDDYDTSGANSNKEGEGVTRRCRNRHDLTIRSSGISQD